MEWLYNFIKSLFKGLNRSQASLKDEDSSEIGSATLTNRENPLTVKYNSQRDNKHKPNSSCNVTSLQMMLSVIDPDVRDDELWEVCNSKEVKEWAVKNIGSWVRPYIKNNKLNQVYAVLAYAGNKVIGQTVCLAVSNLDIKTITDQIDKGHPVLFGGKFTRSGHIVCAIGYNDHGLIVHDPWGNWNTRYKVKEGPNVLYSYYDLENLMSGNGVILV